MPARSFTDFVNVNPMTEDVTMKKSTFKLLIAGFVAVLLVTSFLAGYFVGSARISGATTATQTASQPAQQAAPAAGAQVSADNDPAKGDSNAKVTIIEFSDFQCPFCGRFFQQTLPQVDSDYTKLVK